MKQNKYIILTYEQATISLGSRVTKWVSHLPIGLAVIGYFPIKKNDLAS